MKAVRKHRNENRSALKYHRWYFQHTGISGAQEPVLSTPCPEKLCALQYNCTKRRFLSPNGTDANTGKYYTDMIDLDSFVRKYLLEEVTANYDGGVASSYFYKDIDSISDKLYAKGGFFFSFCGISV